MEQAIAKRQLAEERKENRIYSKEQIDELLNEYNEEPFEIIKKIQSRFCEQDSNKNFKGFNINSKGSDFFQKKVEMKKTKELYQGEKPHKAAFVSLQRLVYTEEQKEKIRFMKENARSWVID